MTRVAVLVGAALSGDAESAARAVLAEQGAETGAARMLSEGRALEIDFSGDGDDAALTEAFRAALPGVDVAVMAAVGRRKRLICADMDSTIVIGETIDELADALGRKTEVAEITARAMRGELDFEAALDARVAMLRGLEAAAIDLVAETLVYAPGARALIATMRGHGAECVLVSGGFDRVTGVVRAALGFHIDRANHLEVGADGRLTGAVRKPVVDSATKITLLQDRAAALGLTLAECMAIGDGANDKPMIAAAGLGVAYRAKPTLKAATRFHIDHMGLRAALYFQGYSDREIMERAYTNGP